jgi:hypothetical protein
MTGSTDTVNKEMILNADPAGFGWGRMYRTLPTIPAGAKRMIVAIRGWYDSFAVGAGWNDKGWNHTHYWGLSFNTDDWEANMASLASQPMPSLLGWAVGGPFQTNSIIDGDYITCRIRTADSKAMMQIGSGSSGSGYSQSQQINVLDGISGVITSVTVSAPSNAERKIVELPANPTVGALFTRYIEVWASAIDKTMYARTCVNMEGLEGADQFNAINTPWDSTLYSWTIHNDVVSTYRPDYDTVVFPNVFKMRFALPTGKMVLKSIRRRFYDWDNTLLGEDGS